MKKLESLTPEQEAQLPGIRDEWIKIGLSCEEMNREEAEAGVREAYRAAGLAQPEYVFWVESPLAGTLASWYVERALEPASAPDSRNKAQVSPIDDQVKQLKVSLAEQLLAAEVPSKDVRAALAVPHTTIPWSELSRHLYNSVNGYYSDIYWLAFYDTFRRFGVEGAERVDGLVKVAKNAGWWFPMEKAVIISNRPKEIHRDPAGQLHCSTGPAISYRDGTAIYMWHGVRVPADLIEGSWTMSQVLKESNTEIRRCAVEKSAETLGWKHMVAEAGWPQIGSAVDDPGNPGQVLSLYKVDNVYDDTVNLLLMVNGTVERDGTRHEFGETVPKHILDPEEAAGWQVNLTKEQYRQTVRRT